jgi:hypothetical protein
MELNLFDFLNRSRNANLLFIDPNLDTALSWDEMFISFPELTQTERQLTGLRSCLFVVLKKRTYAVFAEQPAQQQFEGAA